MSRVTRTLTRRPSVARFSAACFSSGVFAILGGYFYYSASVDEKNLIAAFPTAYPAYRSSTKMLIPFVL